MAETRDERRMCRFCLQELAHTAYFRHLHDTSGTICPGRRTTDHEESHKGSESSESDSVGSDTCSRLIDSTFKLGSNESFGSNESNQETGQRTSNFVGRHEATNELEIDCDCSVQPSSSDDEDIMQISSGFSNSSSDGCGTSSSDGEVWDDSDHENDITENQVIPILSSLLFGISFFVYFFHLFYRLSEKGTVALLSFLKNLFRYLAHVSNSPLLMKLSQSLPKSLHSIRNHFRRQHDLVEFVVCPKCSHLYSISECIIRSYGQEESAKCSHIEFPNHPVHSRRSKCGTVLMKRVKVGRSFKLVPRKTFLYRNLIPALISMAKRPGFLQKCEHWRHNSSERCGDIYGGRVWNDVKQSNGRQFTALPNNLCLGMNIDWFNPYEETVYSVGAIYLVVLNLPRTERYRLENVILVGIIPGPQEPAGDINSFLSPLVKDLNQMYKGVWFRNSSSYLSLTTVSAMLICVTCDLPATRKVLGFANFNALKGCSKCLKEFRTTHFGAKPNFSGYHCQNWLPRDNTNQKKRGLAFKNAPTASARKELLRSYGAKYSEIFQLPYFDVVRHHVIDPMHNIFLGIAKHTTKVWKELNILNVKMYTVLQKKVDSLIPPPKLGRIPRKLCAGFASFTAEEWKNWILLYSTYALYGVLPEDDYRCWSLFVDSCRLLCLPLITEVQITKAHLLIVEFCQMFENLYGANNCTPNMHMACHLKESLLDYGPLASFWCFPFERYNGCLEGMKKSWMGPEKQIFLKFLDLQSMYCLENVHNCDDEFFSSLCKSNDILKESFGKFTLIEQTQGAEAVFFPRTEFFSCAVSSLDATEKNFHCLSPPLKEKCFNDAEFPYLQELYNLLYPNSSIKRISRFYLECKQMSFNQEEYISAKSNSQKSSAIVAHWAGISGIDRSGEAPLRVGQVIYYFRHTVELFQNPISRESSAIRHIIARVKWYMDHPQREKLHPPTIICAATFDPDSSACFIPVSRIAGRAAIAKTMFKFDYGEDYIAVAMPLLKTE